MPARAVVRIRLVTFMMCSCFRWWAGLPGTCVTPAARCHHLVRQKGPRRDLATRNPPVRQTRASPRNASRRTRDVPGTAVWVRSLVLAQGGGREVLVLGARRGGDGGAAPDVRRRGRHHGGCGAAEQGGKGNDAREGGGTDPLGHVHDVLLFPVVGGASWYLRHTRCEVPSPSAPKGAPA